MKIRTYLPLHYQQMRPCGASLLRYYQLRDPDRSGNAINTLDLRQLLRSVCHFLQI